jgi:hypothetical protein
MFSWLCFQINMNNYPRITIAEDGSLCSTGQHRPRFPRMLYDALLHLGHTLLHLDHTLLHLDHNGNVPIYRGRMFTTRGQDRCEVSVTIPLSPTKPWGATVIGVELDEIVEQAAYVTLTALYESRLNDTATMPIALFLIHEQEEPMWRWRL